jgi:archaellum component FlaC
LSAEELYDKLFAPLISKYGEFENVTQQLIESKFNDLKSAIESNATSIGAVKTAVDQNKAFVAGAIDWNRAQVILVKNAVISNEAAVALVDAAVDAVKGVTDNIKSKTDNLDASMSSLKTQVDLITTAVDLVKGVTDNIKLKTDNLDDSISNLKAQIGLSGMESIEILDADRGDNVLASGGTDSITVNADAGYIYEVLGIFFWCQKVSAGGGSPNYHYVNIMSETGSMNLIKLSSYDDVGLKYDYGEVIEADKERYPTSDLVILRNIRGYRIDEDEGITITYVNNGTATQTNPRLCRIWVRKIKIE